MRRLPRCAPRAHLETKKPVEVNDASTGQHPSHEGQRAQCTTSASAVKSLRFLRASWINFDTV